MQPLTKKQATAQQKTIQEKQARVLAKLLSLLKSGAHKDMLAGVELQIARNESGALYLTQGGLVAETTQEFHVMVGPSLKSTRKDSVTASLDVVRSFDLSEGELEKAWSKLK